MATEPSSGSSYIFDPGSPSELARLINQDRLVTRSMGGTLSGIDNPSSIHTVLDMGCGPGSWVLDVAFEHPEMEVAGVDISKPMIDYANARARAQQFTNVSFGVMDITQPLDFSASSFDLVNARLLFAVLLRKAWLPFLAECFRIMKPGSIIRLTELAGRMTNSAALQQECNLLYRFLYLGGYGFSPDGSTIGVATVLPTLLKQLGFEQISQRAHVQDFSQGSPHWSDGYRNQEVLSLSMLPLFVKRGLLSQEDADHLHRQIMIESLADDFCNTGYFHTVQANKPEKV